MLACVNAANHRQGACDNNVGMGAISADQVFRAVDVVVTARSPNTVIAVA